MSLPDFSSDLPNFEAAGIRSLIGVHYDFPDSEYNGDNPEILKFWRSSQIPKNFDGYTDFYNQLVVKKEEKDDTGFFRVGRYVEDVISGKADNWFVYDESERPLPEADFRNAANRWHKLEAEQMAELANKQFVQLSDVDFLNKMHHSELYKETIQRLRESDQQTTIFWEEETEYNGQMVKIPFRVRLDYSTSDWIVDHKTTRHGRKKFTRYDINDHGLKVQAMMQCRGAMMSGYAENPAFSWAVHSKEWPYEFFLVNFDTIEEYTAANWPILVDYIARYVYGGENDNLNIESI